MADTKEVIRDYVFKNVLPGRTSATFSDTDSINPGENFDTTAVMKAITYLEQKFNIQIDSAEITTRNFNTINDIDNLINSKLR